MTLSRTLRGFARVAFVLTAGALTELGLSCTGLAEKVTHSVNPCGTVLACDPNEYDLLTTDFPDWNVDPTCTVPGQCGSIWPGFPGGATNNPNQP